MVILRDTAPAQPSQAEGPARGSVLEPSQTEPQLPSLIPPSPTPCDSQNLAQTSYYGLQILPPLTAVIELVVMVAALLAIDWIWPALDINALQPNPYWLPVLLLTLQYGTASGTLAVIVAIAAYFSFVTLPEQGVGENEFAYRLRILAQPILWIAAAVLLGQFRMLQISAKRELRQRLGELETQRDTLADYANRLRGRCDVLERDIASRPFYAGIAVLDSLAALRAPSGDAASRIADCLAAAFPGAAISLFVREGSALRQSVTTGWPASATWARQLAGTHSLARGILVSRSSLSVLNAADELVLDHQGLAAVPVVDQRSGHVVGMVKLEFGDARLISAQCLTQLEVVATAIAPHLVEHNGIVQVGPGGAGLTGIAGVGAVTVPGGCASL